MNRETRYGISTRQQLMLLLFAFLCTSKFEGFEKEYDRSKSLCLCLCVFLHRPRVFTNTQNDAVAAAWRTFLYTQQLILVFIMNSVIKHRRWDRCARCEFKFYSFDSKCRQRRVYEKKRVVIIQTRFRTWHWIIRVFCVCQHQHAKKKIERWNWKPIKVSEQNNSRRVRENWDGGKENCLESWVSCSW